MSSLSYTDERAKTMLFSDLPMGEEKYYLYADLANSDISASDISSLNGQLPCVLWKMINPFIPMIFINSILQPSLLRLSSDEQEWLKQHGAVRVGYLKDDPGLRSATVGVLL